MDRSLKRKSSQSLGTLASKKIMNDIGTQQPYQVLRDQTTDQCNFNEMNIDDEETNDKSAPHVSSFLETELVEPHGFGGRFAQNMKVNNIIFQNGSHKSTANKTNTYEPMNNIVDTVSIITRVWKKQADAIVLTPTEALQFYKRQYDQLTTILSIALFNTDKVDVTAAKHCYGKDRGEGTKNGGVVKEHAELKRKRPSAMNFNDCEIIVFRKGDKYVFRRVESAAKYAKRSKPVIYRYICIIPKDERYKEETRNCITRIRTSDTGFVTGGEINFKGSHSALYNELIKRVGSLSTECFAFVRFVNEQNVEDTDNESANNENHKRMKPDEPTTSAKHKQVAAARKKADALDNSSLLRRSGVEENTESEDGMIDEYEVERAVESIHKEDGSHIVEDQFSRPPSPFLNRTNGGKSDRKLKRKFHSGPDLDGMANDYISSSSSSMSRN